MYLILSHQGGSPLCSPKPAVSFLGPISRVSSRPNDTHSNVTSASPSIGFSRPISGIRGHRRGPIWVIIKGDASPLMSPVNVSLGATLPIHTDILYTVSCSLFVEQAFSCLGQFGRSFLLVDAMCRLFPMKLLSLTIQHACCPMIGSHRHPTSVLN